MTIPGRFPSVEGVLLDYIRTAMDRGEDWFITPQLNSTLFPRPFNDPQSFGETTINSGGASDTTGSGGGFWSNLFSVVGSVAVGIGKTVAATLPVLASVQGQSQQLRNNFLASQVAQSGVNPNVAAQAAAAARNDLGTGISLPMIALLGGAFVLMFMATGRK